MELPTPSSHRGSKFSLIGDSAIGQVSLHSALEVISHTDEHRDSAVVYSQRTKRSSQVTDLLWRERKRKQQCWVTISTWSQCNPKQRENNDLQFTFSTLGVIKMATTAKSFWSGRFFPSLLTKSYRIRPFSQWSFLEWIHHESWCTLNTCISVWDKALKRKDLIFNYDVSTEPRSSHATAIVHQLLNNCVSFHLLEDSSK